MKLNPPTTIVFWISVVVALAALLGQIGVIGALDQFANWLMIIAFVVLGGSLMMKGA